MDQWVPFRDGEYLVEKAFLVGENNCAVLMEDVVMEVYTDPRGMRQVKGHGMVRNTLVVELLEDTDRLDLVLDLGQGWQFRMIAPDLKAGKVFDPEVKSLLQYAPASPWIEIASEDYSALMERLTLQA